MPTETARPAAEDMAAMQAVPSRIVAAWADNDPDAFAEVFTEDGSLILPGDVFLTSREQIRAFMKAAYAGPYKGTRVTGEPQAIKVLGPDAALLITKGGVLMPGETEVSAEQLIRATWTLKRVGGEWRLTAYQNTRVN
ncbi:SgcJ/EcaC family oxidoreductase [Streptosporangiaceae bacterium NEAU-GS5]|nr:SgcJ/EcaC family oxidoreductase [Streptosporangiaceae bacterium NEAU-GS5]